MGQPVALRLTTDWKDSKFGVQLSAAAALPSTNPVDPLPAEDEQDCKPAAAAATKPQVDSRKDDDGYGDVDNMNSHGADADAAHVNSPDDPQDEEKNPADDSSDDGDSQDSSDDDEDDDDNASQNDEDDDQSQNDGLSEYERLRLARIRRNQQYLAKLGLDNNIHHHNQANKPKPVRGPKPPTRPVPSVPRRSSLGRASKEKVQTYADTMDLRSVLSARLPDKNKPRSSTTNTTSSLREQHRLPRVVYLEFNALASNDEKVPRNYANVSKAHKNLSRISKIDSHSIKND